MKKIVLAACILFAAFSGGQLNAQSAYGKKTVQGKPATTQKNAVGNANLTDTTKKPVTTPAGGAAKPPATTTAAPVTAAPATLKYDTITPGGFDAKPEIALRNNFATDRSQIKDRKPLEYENLREDDNLWSEFIWREIDAREKINQSFMYPGRDDNGDQRFFTILLNAIRNDSVVAFSPDNDRFTTPLSTSQVMGALTGSYDTLDVVDPVSGVVEKTISKKPRFSPDSVYTFRIKEEWIFDKEASRLFVRIIGIAPIAKQMVGNKSEPRLLFWLYYPDLRKSFAKADVYNPKNFSSRMTWEELFEGRFFSSYIIKSSANNPGDKYLSAIIKDPLFRLLEGENIRNRIFNWEQDLWQY